MNSGPGSLPGPACRGGPPGAPSSSVPPPASPPADAPPAAEGYPRQSSAGAPRLENGGGGGPNENHEAERMQDCNVSVFTIITMTVNFCT